MEELDLLRDVFISNGYPEALVQKTLCDSWKGETLKATLVQSAGIQNLEKTEDEFCDILHAPYIQGFSEKLQKKLRKVNVGFIPKKGITMFDHLCHLKQKPEIMDRKNVIYAIGCSTCKKYYLGETGQNFSDRRNQHQNDIKNKKTTNGIYQHVKANRKHKIDWDRFHFVDSEKNWLGRKIKESLYIDALNPERKIGNIMNAEKGLEVDDCWGIFSEEIKNQMQKKINKCGVG